MQVSVYPEINSVLDDAAALSIQRGHYFVGVEHLYEAVLNQRGALPAKFLREYEEALTAAQRMLAEHPWKGGVPTSASNEVFYTPRTAALTQEAAHVAERLGQHPPRAAHLFLALLEDDYAAPTRVLRQSGVSRTRMCEALRAALGEKQEAATKPAARPAPARVEAAASSAAAQAGSHELEMLDEPAPKHVTLADLTRDLSAMAKRGDLEPAVGRDKEIFQLLEVLSRKSKNNAILVGEAGVGKTRIVEGLAARLALAGGGDPLGALRILELNLSALMSGTAYRGAFEEKVTQLLRELEQAQDVVLFIDEIHLIMGAGATDGGGTDLANMLKPALARGPLQCIGATTFQEYRKCVEKDAALDRRFQVIRVEEMSPEATREVLERVAPSLEEYHGVHISRRAIQAAIELTERYLPNRHFPDKAIDVLDQACAHYRLKIFALRSRRKNAGESQPALPEKITPHDIRKVVSRLAGVPVEEITREDRRRIEALEARLKERIKGQDEAVMRVVAAVKRSRAGLSDPNRPDSVMLFLGPTGVGKTQLAKTLADFLFGSQKYLITFDMSEYIEEHTVSRLLGAPPGYVGSQEEGRLAAAVRNSPFCILLFDELEKAHPRVLDALLPLLEEGRMIDSSGRTVSFRNTIIIFTSNAGAEVLEDEQSDRAGLTAVLRQHFRPEFLNRIDEVVPFYPLLFEDIRGILDLALTDLARRLRQKGLRFHMYQGAYEHLAGQSYDTMYGARELRRVVDRLVANPISALLVERGFEPGDRVEVLMEGDELRVRIVPGRRPESK